MPHSYSVWNVKPHNSETIHTFSTFHKQPPEFKEIFSLVLTPQTLCLQKKRTFPRTYYRNLQDAISHSYSLASSNRPSWGGVFPPSPEVGEEFLRNVVYLKVYFNQTIMKQNWTSILTKTDLQWIFVTRFFHHKNVSICILYSFSRTYNISILWIHNQLLCFEVCPCATKYSAFSFWSRSVITSWSSQNVLR